MPRTFNRKTLENEVRIDTYRASGPGGQHVNRTESAVRLVHLPTGVTVTASDTRSQARNREIAFERLSAKLTRLQARPKVRKPTRVPASAQRRRIEAKKKQGTRKAERGGRWENEN